jgi:hypothetical protein
MAAVARGWWSVLYAASTLPYRRHIYPDEGCAASPRVLPGIYEYDGFWIIIYDVAWWEIIFIGVVSGYVIRTYDACNRLPLGVIVWISVNWDGSDVFFAGRGACAVSINPPRPPPRANRDFFHNLDRNKALVNFTGLWTNAAPRLTFNLFSFQQNLEIFTLRRPTKIHSVSVTHLFS